MRVLVVLCTLLAIAVTSSARPKNIGNANEKPTTAVPLVTAKKNDSLNTSPASVEKSNDKGASSIVHPSLSGTTAENKNDHAKSDIASIQTSEAPTSNSKTDGTTAITPTEKIVTNIKPTGTTSLHISTTDIATTTDEVTTAIPSTTMCPPLPDRHFDGLSFLGGIILTVCLIGVGVFLCKYCQNIHEDKYRTL